ncbi:DUF2079 domain-containing protein [Herbidospora mongoliensis]|uniref:DUF2079 domain-containing protein n=1 Tax=Herbidospora mongoliensis TaxID=688067 RepID=UPI001FE0749A|nr:DUF2079 domain-containing protein [Herbidospora mongoliensis]
MFLPITRHLTTHRLGVWSLAWVSAVTYGVLGLVKFGTFRTTIFDLVIVDQAVRGYSTLSAPYAPSVGVQKGAGLDFLQIADHFSPIYALLAPFYAINDDPRVLIFCQAILFAAAIPFLWLYVRRRLGVAAAYLVSAAYAVSWPVAQAVNFDVHEVMFVPVLTAIMIERFDRGKRLPAYLAAFGLLLVKEDMGLMLIGFGAALALTRRRLDGALLAGMGLAGLLLIRGLLIPWAGGPEDNHWRYTHLGDSMPAALWKLISDPLNTFQLVFMDAGKIDLLVLLCWLTLFLCLFSPLILAAAPLVLERLVSENSLWWSWEYHYNAFVVVIVFCAGVDGAVRLRKRLAKRQTPEVVRVTTVAWAVAVAVVAVTQLPRFAFDQLADPGFYDPYERTAAAYEAMSKIPDGAVVEAANHIGPMLTGRTTVLLWERTPRNAPWVLADVAQWGWPWGSPDEQKQSVEERRALGYMVVFEKDGFVVLHKPPN